jgi:hypothetical protein
VCGDQIIMSGIPEADSAIPFNMNMKWQPSGTVHTVQEQLFARSPGHMSKIKAVAHVITSDFCKGKPYPDPKFAAFWDVILRSLVKKNASISKDHAASTITTENIHRPPALMMAAADYSAISLTTHLTAYTVSHPRIQCCSNLEHPDPSRHTKRRSHNGVST